MRDLLHNRFVRVEEILMMMQYTKKKKKESKKEENQKRRYCGIDQLHAPGDEE